MERLKLFERLINAFDEGFVLAYKYDAVYHKYGDEVLYQTEMHLLQFVGKNPKTTATAIAMAMDKTVSACSQIIRKLRTKKLVEQIRNPENNREYYLELTELGWKVYAAHDDFENDCLKRTYHYLNEFSDEDLDTYIKVQKRLNEAFKLDVQENMINLS